MLTYGHLQFRLMLPNNLRTWFADWDRKFLSGDVEELPLAGHQPTLLDWMCEFGRADASVMVPGRGGDNGGGGGGGSGWRGRDSRGYTVRTSNGARSDEERAI